ncbi:MAG: hypothetical protein A2408_02435 [Candidatus Yonathbacteria bacterium RIFOXYC1_FULL_52_10]|uniref:Thioredoxin domain-containing protein n=1 Tax=Candidatus Yonathbacteria bacterium RIFOXYD1_FULL_52_36 TaxID=1802730 RepID=A0A1G2SKY8_9BACT|nr:MAG: hypothetical protein A2408_02435 [Candidatus Yonathbacteria bacterium RIFOXYC1_FULL_52_10]OHA85422.1 MAG: hypothetical protein A2591_03010 [Candidatus Yonathbacteria bacterium RIFOXYD1_FULL_52_36]
MNRPSITGDAWLNSPEITEETLSGKVVLVDFWTYSCVNCLRTIPHLQKLWERYKDKGLIIIGVHTPEFAFEKDPDNVALAIERLGVAWPVVLDNDRTNWEAFANRYWPAKYLTDTKGNIIYTHFGEGAYEETEAAIVAALGIAGKEGADTQEEIAPHEHGAVCFPATPELYCGYYRGDIVNELHYAEDQEDDYAFEGELPEDRMALRGKFFAAAEYVEARGDDAEILLRFKGTEVNLVLCPSSDEETSVYVTLDGDELPRDTRGADVDEDGLVQIRECKMYRLFKSDIQHDALLSVKVMNGAPRAYAFTFSGCTE